MKKVSILFFFFLIGRCAYSQQVRDSTKGYFIIGVPLFRVGESLIHREINNIGIYLGYNTNSHLRYVSAINIYDRYGIYYSKNLLYLNMDNYHIKGVQIKTGMQFLLNQEEYKKVKFLVGYAGGLSKNQSYYTINLSDPFGNDPLLYPVLEKFWMATFEIHGGYNFILLKKLELATYVFVGRKWQTPQLLYDLADEFPILGYTSKNYFINFKIELWYRL